MWLNHRSIQDYQFATINPLQVEESLWRDLPTISLAPSGLESKEAQLPRLVALSVLRDQTRLELLERATDWERSNDTPLLSALLQSDLDAEQLRTHLSRRLLLPDIKRDQVLLRWYDPNVFTHLSWLLEPHQLASLFGPVKRWAWKGPDGDWHQLDRPDDKPEATSHLNPTVEQWETLGRVGVITRMARELKRQRETDQLNISLYLVLDRHLADAYQTLQTQDEADARCLARQYLLFGRRIDQQPPIAGRIRETLQTGTTYVGACAGLDESVFVAATSHPLQPISERAPNHGM